MPTAFTAIPELETERLLLRALGEQDLDRVAAMQSDAETMRWIGQGTTLDRAGSWRTIATMLGHWQLRGYGMWAVVEKETGELVGRVGLLRPEGWPGLECGWMIARDRWGRGYATEAARASVDHAWNSVGADRLISLIFPENVRSQRVAERLGASIERLIEIDGISVPVQLWVHPRPR